MKTFSRKLNVLREAEIFSESLKKESDGVNLHITFL